VGIQRSVGEVLNRSLIVAVASAIATFLLMVVVASEAWAYNLHGCEYDNNSISPIQYRFFSVGDNYENASQGAANAWNGVSVPGRFEEHSTSLDPEVNITDGTTSTNLWAFTSWGCNGGRYSGNEVNVEFYTNNMSGLSAYEKKIVAEHELGHAYGLDDTANQTGCRVMRTGSHKFTCGTMPASDDISGVQAIY